MNFAACPTPDNDTEEDEGQEEGVVTKDPCLTLNGTEDQYASSRSINFSRPRRIHSGHYDTIKSRHNVDGRLSLIKRQSDTAHSEATDITWATATSQDNPGTPDAEDPNSRTITADTLSQQLINSFKDRDSRNESPRDKIQDNAMYQGKMESPVTPAEESSSSLNVWDELEAIKRRLRQLESTQSPERPHSRGTATSSSSPQRSSPFPSHAGTSMSSTSSSGAYPLLHAAITKVKASGLSSEITQAIEATAQEAVSLTSIATHDQSPSPRSLRKKVDGVCRGLAEVCLALADQQQQSQRYQFRAAQHRAEDAQDSSPLSATGRQSMTLSRVTSKRLSNASLSRIDTTLNRPRRPALSTVGDDEDDMMSTISRPGISRYSTIQYRPSSRAGTEIFRDTTNAAISNLQRFTTTRRLFSRHGPSMSDHQIRATAVDNETASEIPPMPLTSIRSTFDRSTIGTSAASDNRRRSLNLQSYFNSPPRITQVEVSKLPTPPRRPISLISPPRVNVAHRNHENEERRDGTVRGRPAVSVLGGDIMDDGRSTIGRAAGGNPNRRSLGAGDVRRQVSITRKHG